MTRSDPKVEKAKVKQQIDQIVGPMASPNRRRQDWLVNTRRDLSVFVTFSQDDPAWFDLNRKDLHSWQSYSRAFVVFVMRDHSEALIIPVPSLAPLLNNHMLDGGGNFNLHINFRGGRYRFTELPAFDLTPFHNNYTPLLGLSAAALPLLLKNIVT